MTTLNKDLACPNCKQSRCRTPSRVHPKNDLPHERTLRAYTCTNCGHHYETEERVINAPIRVKVGGEQFGRERFLRFLRIYAPKRLLPEDQELVLEEVLNAIADAPPNAGKTDTDGYLVLDRNDVARFTSRAFRTAAKSLRQDDPTRASRLDAAHIQYALATQGSTWESIENFLNWFKTIDHKPRTKDIPERSRTPAPKDWVVPSGSSNVTIREVVKNKFEQGVEPRTRAREPYSQSKLQKTIQLAIRGRTNSGFLPVAIQAYVERGLAGQTIVRSSQLSSLVAEALRGTDEIAYLRWVMIGKELDMTTVFDEATALLTHPSGRIAFKSADNTQLRTHD